MTTWVRFAARGFVIFGLLGAAFAFLLVGEMFVPALRAAGRAPAGGLIASALAALLCQVTLIAIRFKSRASFEGALETIAAEKPR
ncbi:MAG: hypothetical protein JWO81_1341 [Alphaproteobacteria bacterium]|nr:hypothetical protein [Alphaproteobacteria bacterium]